MNFKPAPFLLLLCIVLSTSCAKDDSLKAENLTIITEGGPIVSISTELAITQQEQEKGLMGRKNIPDGTGMIFIYTSDRVLYFWMKNTVSPLSIAFIDSQGLIREIKDMTPLSLQTVASERSVRYALEVPQGWFSRAGISVGDKLSKDSLEILRKVVK